MVIFSTLCGGFVEILVAGLTFEQSLKIRLAAIPIILFAGRPYGIYRDWLFKRLVGEQAAQLKAALIDTFANVTFQVPLYIALLTLNGATIGQVFTAVGSIALITAISGRPYGLFLVSIRKLFGLSANEDAQTAR